MPFGVEWAWDENVTTTLNRRLFVARLGLLALLVSGAIGYFYCAATHFCRDGHGYHIQDVKRAEALELTWILSFVVAIALVWILPASRKLWKFMSSSLLCTLILSRLLLESGRGTSFTFEGIALTVVGLLAVQDFLGEVGIHLFP
jgi:hypothetical protein